VTVLGGEASDEAHVSTEQSAPSQDARVPSADEHEIGPRSLATATAKRTVSAHAGALLRLRGKVLSVKKLPAHQGSENMPDERFRKSERLHKRRDFLKVYAEGKRYNLPLFIIFARASEQPVSRLGITVSRKIGKAVRRNRAKRLIREVFRKNKGRFPFPLDLVVNVKEAIREADYWAVEAEFLRFIERVTRDLRERGSTSSHRLALEPQEVPPIVRCAALRRDVVPPWRTWVTFALSPIAL